MEETGTEKGSVGVLARAFPFGRAGRAEPPRALRDPLYVEVSPLLTPHITGIGRFVARLVEALAAHTPLRLVSTISGAHARNMHLSTDLQCGEEICLSPRDVSPADTDVGMWARRLLKRRKQRHDRELAGRCAGIYTLLRPPARHFRRELSVLYDFTPVLTPWAHVAETREHFGIFFSEASGLSDKAVAISQSTKDDAAWLSALPSDDVVVGYPGPSLCVHAHAHSGPVSRSRNIILVVSTLEPRKNGPFLLDWFLNTKALDPAMELWWVGPDGWLSQGSRRRPQHPRSANIKFPGMVPDRQLCELYQRAAFAIYPSLYEGFGFPVLDALHHGTPVVCSFNSSLQEFAGPGVYYFDAGDSASLDMACRELTTAEPVPLRRHDLSDRFSWDLLARTVLRLCE